jgi:hypothetical protein
MRWLQWRRGEMLRIWMVVVGGERVGRGEIETHLEVQRTG